MTGAADLPAGMVRSLPAAIHVRTLRFAGVPDAHIRAQAAHEAGPLPAGVLRRAAAGKPISRTVEARLLAIRIPECRQLAVTMPAVGTRRRLAGLVWMGWPLRDLADAMGWKHTRARWVMSGRCEYRTVTRREHLQAAALYDQRWDWRPEDHGVPAEAAEVARESAIALGYTSPLSWDDDGIDLATSNPNTKGTREFGVVDLAAVMRRLEGEPIAIGKLDRTAAVEYGARYRDLEWQHMADLLDTSFEAVKRSWERTKRKARNQGKAWPDSPRWAAPDPWDLRPPARRPPAPFSPPGRSTAA